VTRFALAALGLLCAASGWAGPGLYFNNSPDSPAFGTIDLTGLNSRTIAILQHEKQGLSRRQSLLSVHIQSDTRVNAALPPVTGHYAVINDDTLRFTPRYPLMPGKRYQARANLKILASGNNSNDFNPQAASLELNFALPEKLTVAETLVNAVYPSATSLPENLLRLYIHFSKPMQSGHAREGVYLLDASGKRLTSAFLDLRTELWNPEMTRLTLLLDPGRIKRGVGPNLDGGSPLQAGERYTLVVDAGMKDADGNALKQGFSKQFSVSEPLRDRIVPEMWELKAPPAGSRQALELTFSRALDHAMLLRVIHVVNVSGKAVAGHIDIADNERSWRLTPAQPWLDGRHQLQIHSELEDISGNNIRAPFDLDTRSDMGISTKNPVTVTFIVKARHKLTASN
jgi:hypothetical protein